MNLSPLESKEQKKIIDYLEKKMGWWVIKIITANKKGKPDVLACDLYGRFWAFEIKREGEEARKLQQYNIDEIKKRYGNAYAVQSLAEVNDIVNGVR